jgi:hypothetical protein
MDAYKTKKLRCKHCGYRLETAFGLEEPIAGTLSICMGCGALSRFTKNLDLEEVTKEEFDALPVEHKDTIRLIQAGIQSGIIDNLGLEIAIDAERN